MSLARRANVRYTYKDYLLFPEGKRYEIIDGDLHSMTPAPTFSHQTILLNLAVFLKVYVEKHNEGIICVAPCDVVLSEEDIVQPDLLFVSKQRLGIINEKNIRGAPDLVIEVLSPSTQNWDRRVKMATYAKFGILEYWLVDPDAKAVEVYEWTEKGFKLWKLFPIRGSVKSKVLKKISLPVKKIFTK